MTLTSEIIKRIFNNISVIINDSFLLKESLSLKYDNSNIIKNYNIWGGEISFDSSKFRCLITNISEESLEYICVFQLDSHKIYGLVLPEDEEDSIFVILHDNKWVTASIYLQAQALVGSEIILNFKFNWGKISLYKDLFEYLSNLIPNI